MPVTLEVNGERTSRRGADGRRLLAVLRDDLELLGTKLALRRGRLRRVRRARSTAGPSTSCLLLADAADGPRDRDDRGPLDATGRRAPGGVRRRGRAPVRLLHAGPDRHARRRCSSATPQPTPRADPRGDGRQPLPLRRLSEDRARDPARRRRPRDAALRHARSKEMEGRYEDVWALVDEADDVETWPDGRRARARRPAGAAPGRRRAGRRAARATRSTSRLAGMLHAARAALAGRARPRHARSTSTPRARRPGRAGRDRPRRASSRCDARSPLLAAEPGYAGAADRGRRGGHARGGAGGRRGARARPRGARARRRPAGRPSTSSASPTDPSDDCPRRRRGRARRRRRDGRARRSRRRRSCRRRSSRTRAVASWDGD